MTRIYECQTDEVFARLLRCDPNFRKGVVRILFPGRDLEIAQVEQQTRHRGPAHTGTIDLEVRLSRGIHLLIENKIDAGYSVTAAGDAQPERYRASVMAITANGNEAHSVLLAPQIYLDGADRKKAFDLALPYEDLVDLTDGEDRILIERAIEEAATPYIPDPNERSAAFFRDYRDYVARNFPSLAMKRNPNGKGVRPTGSRTIYFDVPRTLRSWPNIPRPKMSLQCWDSNAQSASVKIMIGGWANFANHAAVPEGLSIIGGYFRPAGRSLGIVIDTPKLDTQHSFESQVEEIQKGLEAADRLVKWYNTSGDHLSYLAQGE